MGRIQRRLDSFGATWYSYDAAGNITQLLRDRRLGTCATGSDNGPGSTFSYTKGQLTGEVYPHGRTISYGYGPGGDADRITSISANINGASTVLLSGISYEPYGSVRSYNIQPPLNSTVSMPVEYLLGANSSSAAATPACSDGRPGASDYDQTGRLRALWVSSSTAGSGDVFKRFFTYSGDQTTIEDTCFLDNTSTTPRRVVYASGGNVANHDGYDGQLRLAKVSRPSGQLGSLGGTVGRREYNYDDRGNRSDEIEDCWAFQETYSASSPDKLLSRNSVTREWDGSHVCPGSPKSSTSYAYDKDGRVASENWGSGQGGINRSITFDDAAWAGNGLDGVYREVSVNGVSYQYLYDAFGRRRDKVYANGTDNEFFYDDSRMIEDRDAFSAADLTQGATAAADEYIWLDGKPVVMIRAQVVADQGTGATHDGPDFGTSCDRGDGVPCGVYFLVNDAIGKPVLVIDSNGRAAGEVEYTPFGMPNRVTYIADTPHPYVNTNGGSDLYASLRQSAGPNEKVQARVRFTDLETSGPSDRVFLSDGTVPDGGTDVADIGGDIFGSVGAYRMPDAGTPATGGPGVGLDGTPITSGWVTLPSNGLLQARFVASQAGQAYGVTIAGFDYRRFQNGATPVWTHLGLPGQYYDPETDLFENWHRYYDANTGRYLEPDKVWRYLEDILQKVSEGIALPVYAYANSDPLTVRDSTGDVIEVSVAQGYAGTKEDAAALMDKLNSLLDEYAKQDPSGYSAMAKSDTVYSFTAGSVGGEGRFGTTDTKTLTTTIDLVKIASMANSSASPSHSQGFTLAHEAFHQLAAGGIVQTPVGNHDNEQAADIYGWMTTGEPVTDRDKTRWDNESNAHWEHLRNSDFGRRHPELFRKPPTNR